jgi:branched-subunit amino acid aminotransferase/4-amino-4-deoxychorismate lyase
VIPGVLETIRIRAGRAPLLDRHWARLRATCQTLGIPVPDRPLEDLVAPWIGPEDCVIRVEVRGPAAVATSRRVPDGAGLDVAIAATVHTPYPHKVTDRNAFEAAQAEARGAGADDALLLTARGVIAEGTAWTVFWWEADRLMTPPLTLGVLPGVARGRIMELAQVGEAERRPAELAGHSLFAANAVRGVIAIRSLDGVPVPQDPRTNEIVHRFWP